MKLAMKIRLRTIRVALSFFPLSGAELEDYVAQDAKADAVGDGVTEHHRDHRDESGEGFTDIREVEELHRVKHQYTYEDQGATGCSTGDQQEDW